MNEKAPKKEKKVRKTKVSFDIDPSFLERIKKIVDMREEMRLADFFREAAEKKLEIEEKYIVIYIFVDTKGIQKLTVERGLYDIRLKEASDDMRENVGAVQEGELELLRSEDDLGRFYQDKQLEVGSSEPILDYSIYIDSALQKLFEEKEVVYFFTKTRY